MILIPIKPNFELFLVTRIMIKYLLFFFAVGISTAAFAQGENIPVRITVFDAGIASGKVTLNWQTACSLEFATFDLQRSSDGIHFSTVTSLTANKSRCAFPFFIVDSNLNPGSGRYFYKLLVSDIDGKLYSSKTVSLFSSGNGFEINGISPSVVRDVALISISSATNGVSEWVLINQSGLIVQKRTISFSKGATSFQLNTSALSAGIYSLVVAGPESGKRVVRFLKM